MDEGAGDVPGALGDEDQGVRIVFASDVAEDAGGASELVGLGDGADLEAFVGEAVSGFVGGAAVDDADGGPTDAGLFCEVVEEITPAAEDGLMSGEPEFEGESLGFFGERGGDEAAREENASIQLRTGHGRLRREVLLRGWGVSDHLCIPRSDRGCKVVASPPSSPCLATD